MELISSAYLQPKFKLRTLKLYLVKSIIELATMTPAIFTILVATALTQLMNILFIKYVSNESVITSTLTIVMYSLPLQIAASMCYPYYYSQGVKLEVNYFYLSLISVSLGLLLSLLINLLYLSPRAPTTLELGACMFTAIGIGLFLLAKS